MQPEVIPDHMGALVPLESDKLGVEVVRESLTSGIGPFSCGSGRSGTVGGTACLGSRDTLALAACAGYILVFAAIGIRWFRWDPR